jgi:endonuclease/exonuclease/phosphatase (EEP) superfamily protein YafD
LLGRYLPVTNHLTLFAAACSPYFMWGAPASFLILIVLKRWIPATIAACLTVGATIVQLPIYLGSTHDASATASVRVMTANLKLGQADANALVAATRSGIDVLAVQELTFDEVDRLSKAGLDKIFPYRVLRPHTVASGAGLYSRFPIHSATSIGKFEMAFFTARIEMPSVAVDPTMVVAHLSGPWPQPIDQWDEDMRLLPPTMADIAKKAGSGAVIVAGDFNSTIDMQPFRQLLQDGYQDAAEQAGAGMTRSYPADSTIPPLLGIDHILIRDCTASSATTVPLPGSDHRALLATLQIPHQ